MYLPICLCKGRCRVMGSDFEDLWEVERGLAKRYHAMPI